MKNSIIITIPASMMVLTLVAFACGFIKEANQSSVQMQSADDAGGGGAGVSTNAAFTPAESSCDQYGFQNAYWPDFLLNKNTAENGKPPAYPRFYSSSTWIRLFTAAELDPYGDFYVLPLDQGDAKPVLLGSLGKDDEVRQVRVLEVDEVNKTLTVTPDKEDVSKAPRRYLIPKNCLNCVELTDDGKYDTFDQCIIYPE